MKILNTGKKNSKQNIHIIIVGWKDVTTTLKKSLPLSAKDEHMNTL